MPDRSGTKASATRGYFASEFRMVLFLGRPGCESSELKLFRPLSQSASSQSCPGAKNSELE